MSVYRSIHWKQDTPRMQMAGLLQSVCQTCGSINWVYYYTVEGASSHIGFACGHRFKCESMTPNQWYPIKEFLKLDRKSKR